MLPLRVQHWHWSARTESEVMVGREATAGLFAQTQPCLMQGQALTAAVPFSCESLCQRLGCTT